MSDISSSASGKIRICYDCQNFKNVAERETQKDIWYNHLCIATIFPTVIDPTTGGLMFRDPDGFVSEKAHPYCRDINRDGKCGSYVETTDSTARRILGNILKTINVVPK